MVPSHLISTKLEHLPFDDPDPDLTGRIMLCKRADMLSIECIVRGYLSGSAWKEYRTSGTMNGTRLPDGLEESSPLPEPVFTPSTKAEMGDHDENVSFERACDIVGTELAELSTQIDALEEQWLTLAGDAG